MKAWIFSDLHLEINPASPIATVPKADVCICAGDIFDGGLTRSIDYLGEHVSPHMPVVFVPGNREYWRSSIVEGLRDGLAYASSYPNLHILHRSALVLGGFRFVGATFWTEFDLFGPHDMAKVKALRGANDYRRIIYSRKPFQRLSVEKSKELHLQDRLFIQSNFWDGQSIPTVVVTHHAPSILSVPPMYIDDPLMPAFASRFEKTIIKYRPLLWIHGHLHNRSDYKIQGTRVVCNPFGYPGEDTHSGFDPSLVIELGVPSRATTVVTDDVDDERGQS